jgi:hypothetical protein
VPKVPGNPGFVLPGYLAARGGSARAAAHFSALASRRRVATQLSERREGFRAFETEEVVNMKKFIPIVCMSILSFGISFAQDPAKVDPAHYKVILDNKQVRVLDVRQKPGDKALMHSHPNHVVYALTGETLKFTLPDGKTNTVTLRARQATWRNAETHTVENVGKNEAAAKTNLRSGFNCGSICVAESRRRNFHRLLRELPERDDHAENEKRIKNGFEQTASFLFGAHEKGVGGFVLAVHKRWKFDNLSCATFMSAAAPNTRFHCYVSILREFPTPWQSGPSINPVV